MLVRLGTSASRRRTAWRARARYEPAAGKGREFPHSQLEFEPLKEWSISTIKMGSRETRRSKVTEAS
jgi:hypothetical protein